MSKRKMEKTENSDNTGTILSLLKTVETTCFVMLYLYLRGFYHSFLKIKLSFKHKLLKKTFSATLLQDINGAVY